MEVKHEEMRQDFCTIFTHSSLKLTNIHNIHGEKSNGREI